MKELLDYLTWTTFVDLFPYVCLLLGFLVFCAGGLIIGTRLLLWLLGLSSSLYTQIGRYLAWKLPRVCRRQTTQKVTTVNVGENECVVYLDGRFVGTDAVLVPIALLQELGIAYEERRICMRWFKENDCKMPDYLEEITLLNEE